MIEVAKLGKTVGVYGGLKLHITSDFPHIFHEDIVFYLQQPSGLGVRPAKMLELRVKSFDGRVIVFFGYESLESAKGLTNASVYVSEEDTRRFCVLGEGEAFWFDVVGSEVLEGEERLGVVREIERIAGVDYLIIDAFVEDFAGSDLGVKLPKSFMLPYIPRYIVSFEDRKIQAQGAKEIWLAS